MGGARKRSVEVRCSRQGLEQKGEGGWGVGGRGGGGCGGGGWCADTVEGWIGTKVVRPGTCGKPRPFLFPPLPSRPSKRRKALFDPAKRARSTFTALIHALSEKVLAQILCRTSITPNQLTIRLAICGSANDNLFPQVQDLGDRAFEP